MNAGTNWPGLHYIYMGLHCYWAYIEEQPRLTMGRLRGKGALSDSRGGRKAGFCNNDSALELSRG